MTTTDALDASAPISSHQGAEVDLLASTLHHVLQGITHHTHHSDHPQDDKHTGIDLVVDSDVLTLKGNGAEVDPALLSGHIVLDLAESTTVKQITLQFRGKAKLPPVENEPWVSFLLNASHKADRCSEFLPRLQYSTQGQFQ
jgi:hypothetical protein